MSHTGSFLGALGPCCGGAGHTAAHRPSYALCHCPACGSVSQPPPTRCFRLRVTRGILSGHCRLSLVTESTDTCQLMASLVPTVPCWSFLARTVVHPERGWEVLQVGGLQPPQHPCPAATLSRDPLSALRLAHPEGSLSVTSDGEFEAVLSPYVSWASPATIPSPARLVSALHVPTSPPPWFPEGRAHRAPCRHT